MPGRECYHCRQWIDEGQAHDCWTTTEAALTRELTDDLRDAWERLREAAAELGEQRIYASHNSIMFSRKSCYFFVRPRRTFLEVCIFLGRAVNTPPVRRVHASSKTKFAHMLKVTHRDEVEAPMTDWLVEAYEYCMAPRAATRGARAKKKVAKRPPRRSPALKKPAAVTKKRPAATKKGSAVSKKGTKR